MSKKVICTIVFISLVLLLIVIFGIFSNKSGTMICTYTAETDVYKISTRYVIKYKDKIVESLSTTEEITSDKEGILDEYKTSLDLIYSKYSKLKYYNNSIKLKENKLISTTNINYEKVDKNQFISIDKNNGNLYTSSHVMLKNLRKRYKELGARCTYK